MEPSISECPTLQMGKLRPRAPRCCWLPPALHALTIQVVWRPLMAGDRLGGGHEVASWRLVWPAWLLAQSPVIRPLCTSSCPARQECKINSIWTAHCGPESG